MNALAQLSTSTSTLTPISEAIAAPVWINAPPGPELSEMAPPAWKVSVLRQLEGIINLEEGWDGFGAGPVRRDVLGFALLVLQDVMRPSTPAPHIAPMSHEGLMIEWHTHGIDLEVEIEKPGSLWVSFEDAVCNIEAEEVLSTNLSMLADAVQTLSDRS